MPDPVINTLPAAPQPTDDRASFSAKSFAFFSALAAFISEVNAIVVWIAAQVLSVATNATAAALARADSTAAAAAASMHANATQWVSGANYADGQVVWSPITYQTYRRRGAGAGATDPSSDTVAWVQTDRSPVGTVFAPTVSTQAVAFGTYVMPAAAINLTLPLSPLVGDWVGVVPCGSTVAGQWVVRNGQKIMDKGEDMAVDVDAAPFRLAYTGATRGWVLVD